MMAVQILRDLKTSANKKKPNVNCYLQCVNKRKWADMVLGELTYFIVIHNVVVCVCVCIPESAVEPHSLAMMLPVRRSSTRQLNWQLGERRQGDTIRRGDGEEEEVSRRFKARTHVRIQRTGRYV